MLIVFLFVSVFLFRGGGHPSMQGGGACIGEGFGGLRAWGLPGRFEDSYGSSAPIILIIPKARTNCPRTALHT